MHFSIGVVRNPHAIDRFPMYLPIKKFLRKVYRPIEVIHEAWLAPRAPHNPKLFKNLYNIAKQKEREPRQGFYAYLRNHSAIGQFGVIQDWLYDEAKELSLKYSSTIFKEGTIHAHFNSESQHVLIFLPGFYVGAEQVLRDTKHPQYLVDLASQLNASLVTWTWPLQGKRSNGGIFEGMSSVVSIEREYARILPSLSTSLWREMIAELGFVLNNIDRLFNPGHTFHVVGWSMGGSFAYFAPLLSSRVRTVVSTGSCARIIDLIQSGRTRAHSLYFYPHDCFGYFDLDDITAEIISRQVKLRIIYGENDLGCLDTSSNAIAGRVPPDADFGLRILPGHGHYFSAELKSCIIDSLASFVNPSLPGTVR